MQNNRETEIKIKITEKIYNQLLSMFKIIKGPCKQDNIFFDSDDLIMLKNRWALRLRCEDEGYILTTKGPAENKDREYFDRPEIEETIEKKYADMLLGGFSLKDYDFIPCEELYKRFGQLHLNRFLSFVNSRTYLDFNNLILELDKTTIKSDVFYEIEIETDKKNVESVLEKIEILFKNNNWFLEYSKKSKMAKAVKLFKINIKS